MSENRKLENLQSEQRKLVTRLERQENDIRKELAKQRESERELTNRIDAIIEAEREVATLSKVDMSELSSAFEKQRGRLPWPVEEGFISSKYGKHRHPTLKRVELNNKGIDIQTTEDAYIMAVTLPGNTALI